MKRQDGGMVGWWDGETTIRFSLCLQAQGMEDAEKAVESLRSGEAAGVAAKQMMARRGSAGRPLSKLTPGTVKYAVYFVLAFEGPRGLSVADIVQKVQVSREGCTCDGRNTKWWVHTSSLDFLFGAFFGMCHHHKPLSAILSGPTHHVGAARPLAFYVSIKIKIPP